MTGPSSAPRIEAKPVTAGVVVRSILFAVAFYGTTAAFLVLGMPLLLAPRWMAMAGLRAHARTIVWLLRVICNLDCEVRGRDRLPAGPCIVAAKHQSAWDTIALIPLLHDPAIVLKAELLSIPLYGWFCRKFEHIAVVRERAGPALRRMLADAGLRLAEGRQVLVFPEGTRRAPGAPADYKPGVVALYEAGGVPCVPLALNSGLFWARRSIWRFPGTVVVEFLEPIEPGLPRRAFRERLVTRLEAACTALLCEGSAGGSGQRPQGGRGHGDADGERQEAQDLNRTLKEQ